MISNLMWRTGCEGKVKSLCVVDFKDKSVTIIAGVVKVVPAG